MVTSLLALPFTAVADSSEGTGLPHAPLQLEHGSAPFIAPAESSEGSGHPQASLQLQIASEAWIVPADSSHGTGRPQASSQTNLSDEPSIVPADNGEGTGQRILLSFKHAQQLIAGSGTLNQGYSQLNLDAFGAQSTQSNWGHAEVLLGCHQADVLVYQNVDGLVLEVFATQIAIDHCTQ